MQAFSLAVEWVGGTCTDGRGRYRAGAAYQHGVSIANLGEVKTDQAQLGASFEIEGEHGLHCGWASVAAPILS